jgi:glycosyltransferase involved in cell wall biosynthesis
MQSPTIPSSIINSSKSPATRKPVLTIFFQFNPWKTSLGGIQTIIRSFIKYAPDTFEIRLVGTGDAETPARLGWQKKELEGRSIDFLPLFDLPEDNHRKLLPTTVQYTAALLRQVLLKNDCASDFMHFHRIEPTMLSLRWPGEKTFFLHNDIQQHMAPGKNVILWGRFPKVYYAMERLLVKQFDEILSCNTNSIDVYCQQYPDLADRIHFIKNSFDGDVFFPVSEAVRDRLRSELAQELNLTSDRQFLLFAGRLHPQKDPLLLLEAFRQVTSPRAHLLIAGAGELMLPLRERIASLDLGGRVTLLGPVPQAKLAQLHRLSESFVLSSVFEGLPLVALETLACGTRLVTTDAGDTPNILLPNTGIVCRDRNATTLASAIDRILQNPDQFPREACAQSVQDYSARSIVSSVFDAMYQRWCDRITLEGDEVGTLLVS